MWPFNLLTEDAQIELLVGTCGIFGIILGVVIEYYFIKRNSDRQYRLQVEKDSRNEERRRLEDEENRKIEEARIKLQEERKKAEEERKLINERLISRASWSDVTKELQQSQPKPSVGFPYGPNQPSSPSVLMRDKKGGQKYYILIGIILGSLILIGIILSIALLN